MTLPSSAFLRWPAAVALLVAAVAHVPVIPEHLDEAPYMGVAFIGFTVAAAVAALVVVLRRDTRLLVAAGGLCAAAVAVYALTRLVAFPQLADDVGNWTETLGLVSIVSETLVVVLAAIALQRAAALDHHKPAVICPDSGLRASRPAAET